MDWKIAMDSIVKVIRDTHVCNAIWRLLLFEQQTGMFLRPHMRRLFITRACMFHRKYKRRGLIAKFHGSIPII